MAAMEGCSRSDRAHSPNTWGVLRLQLHHEKPWHRPGLSNDEIFVMLANEVKACLYELQREHVEYFYKDSGWPAKEEAWNALGQERDVMFAADEVAPDKDGIGTRYGLTYRAAREKVLPDRADHENGVAAENERHWLTRLFIRWAHRVFLQDEVRARLEEARYPVALKEVIRGAFSDLSEFKIGTKNGRRLMDQLGNEEAGQRALALTATRQATIRRLIDNLLEEPFGIQRDFRHLLSEARIGFKLAVREAGHRIYPMPSALILDDVQCSDTYGLSPGGVFDSARQAQRPGDAGLSLFLDRWSVLFLDRVRDIARRWRGDEKLDSLMTELIEEVRQFDILASVRQATEKDGPLFSEIAAQMAGPAERTAVERAQGRIVEALRELVRVIGAKHEGTSNSPNPVSESRVKEWPDLKTLALYYAYRWEVEGKQVDFTSLDEADAIAIEAGFKSGKTLLEHYRRYTVGHPDNRRIERTMAGKRTGDLLRRFETVVRKLTSFPQSLEKAQAEHAIVRTRKNGSEE